MLNLVLMRQHHLNSLCVSLANQTTKEKNIIPAMKCLFSNLVSVQSGVQLMKHGGVGKEEWCLDLQSHIQ